MATPLIQAFPVSFLHIMDNKVIWNCEDAQSWVKRQDTRKWKYDFEDNGFLVLDCVVDGESLDIYRSLYQDFITGKLNASRHRHDLGNHVSRKWAGRENICQIMWPSLYVQGLTDGPIHQRAKWLARNLYGDDMDFDFDMLISKEAKTSTETPWHSDEAYWPDMLDKRSMSFWFPMDDATVENGCMWFVPGSHKEPLYPHHQAKEGYHVLTCDFNQTRGIPQPIPAGSCTSHDGRTLHYTGGNTTGSPRRAFIVNFRPQAMVEWEREHGFDHGKEGIEQLLEKDLQM